MARRWVRNGVLRMDKVREILRLSELGFSQRAIHRNTGVARSSIQEYLRAAEVSATTYECAKGLNDVELKSVLGRRGSGRTRTGRENEPNFEELHRELKEHKGVTLELLWKEWLDRGGKEGYSYSTFCRRYREYAKTSKLAMRREYEPGAMLLSDYAGVGLSYRDADGCEHEVTIFVACLGFSNYTYAEATDSAGLTYWIGSHKRACTFFGGVPQAIIIDNLKTGVTRSHRYEPEIQRTFAEFGEHYGTTIFPVRVNKPQDKAKVEKAVQHVERHLLAPLRKREFRSLAEINESLVALLQEVNAKPMKTYGVSRNELFVTVEQPRLRPLPLQSFTLATWKTAKVAPDYHVEVERHYYSVPYYHRGKTVDVKITEKLVEVFLNNERIATHVKQFSRFRFSTTEAHMPPNHRAVKSWTAEGFEAWAQTVGPNAVALIQIILELPQFKEQGFRSILGIRRLGEKYGTTLIEEAAAIAIDRKQYSQRAVRKILEELLSREQGKQSSLTTHSNLRGGDYYH